MYRSSFAFVLAMAVLAAILVPSSLPAQITFQRTYGGASPELGWSVRQTSDGGYIMTASTESFGSGLVDIYVVKTGSWGETLWTRTYGGIGYDFGNCIEQVVDGDYIIAGYTTSYGAGNVDVYLVKTNASGETLWARTYGGTQDEAGYSVQHTADGGYVVAGYSVSFGAGGADCYLLKTDSQGDTMWTGTYGGTQDDAGWRAGQTADGGYVVVGVTKSFGAGDYDVYLVKTDSLGVEQWTRTYGGAAEDDGRWVQQTADGGYIIAGFTSSFGAGTVDIYLVKTNAQGDTQWTRTYGGASLDYGQSVQQTADGGYIVAGSTSSYGAGGVDALLIKTDSLGDTLWTRTFGGGNDEVGNSVQQTADGGFILAGTTSSFGAGLDDVYLVKTDSLGNVAVAEPKANPTREPTLSLSCEPNPASGTTTIHLTPFASRHSPLALRIYDAQGRAVRSFSLLSPPSFLTWDGRDDRDQRLPSGTYFLRLAAGCRHATTRLVLTR